MWATDHQTAASTLRYLGIVEEELPAAGRKTARTASNTPQYAVSDAA